MGQLSLRERHRQRVTTRIIAVAEALFKAHGFQKTTMDAIAAEAEISRATLFNYFPSKEDLLLLWTREILEQQVQPRLEAYLNTQPSCAQALHMLYAQVVEIIRAFPDVVRAFTGEASITLNPARMGDADLRVRQVFVRILRYGQERGEVRSDIPLDCLARYLNALLASLVWHLLQEDAPEDAELAIGRLSAFLEGGLYQSHPASITRGGAIS